jgi:hypothetical protein
MLVITDYFSVIANCQLVSDEVIDVLIEKDNTTIGQHRMASASVVAARSLTSKVVRSLLILGIIEKAIDGISEIVNGTERCNP